jgi:hypothetical protein
MTITPELAEVIAAAIDDQLIDVHVSLPGVVQSYNSATQTATIELQVRRALTDDNDQIIFEDLPVIQNVPVCFPRSSVYFVSFPIVPGDTGDVIFAETSIGQWRAVEGTAFPDDIGRHTLSGAKFYPGLSKDSAPLTDTLTEGIKVGVIGGAQMTIKTDGTIKLENALGDAELKTTGQWNVNNNLTVDP